MKSDLLIQIITELNKIKHKGISAYRLAQKLGESEPAIRYHFKKLKEARILKKRKSKYYLDKSVFSYNGMVILEFPSEGFIFLNCIYRKNCDCSKTTDECRMIKNLPNWLKDRMYYNGK